MAARPLCGISIKRNSVFRLHESMHYIFIYLVFEQACFIGLISELIVYSLLVQQHIQIHRYGWDIGFQAHAWLCRGAFRLQIMQA